MVGKKHKKIWSAKMVKDFKSLIQLRVKHLMKIWYYEIMEGM